ncbi:MAG: DUF882 domain-containing protein [Myxococcales bacterium]|nr:DUF882 domain-containing protein [Myxococcales bacterium]
MFTHRQFCIALILILAHAGGLQAEVRRDLEPALSTDGDGATEEAVQQAPQAREADNGAASTSEPGVVEPVALEHNDEAADEGRAQCGLLPVLLRRMGPPVEEQTLVLTRCEGPLRDEALDALSQLARAKKPRSESNASDEAQDEAARPVVAGLLDRLHAIATRWPGRTIELVSGHRPRARAGSRHRRGAALDLRVEGVENGELAEWLAAMSETGVGFYPNSSFVHVDVRETAVRWVDRSGPGQAPDYGPWPTPASGDPVKALREQLLASVEEAIDNHFGELGEHSGAGPGAAAVAVASAKTDPVTTEAETDGIGTGPSASEEAEAAEPSDDDGEGQRVASQDAEPAPDAEPALDPAAERAALAAELSRISERALTLLAELGAERP